MTYNLPVVLRRKLQVFVSSTYTDLRDERQAAVSAILAAGHIPAGMELFAAGDEGQMTVIRRWIDESDAFMLILGSRYGSIEPSTQKSYVQLEYEYAVAALKPYFAVVKERDGVSGDPDPGYEQFRESVLQRIVRFWREPTDIKLAIHETLSEFSRRPELRGWSRGDNVDVGRISEEVARLSRENATLRDRLAAVPPRLFNGLTLEELTRLLASTKLEIVSSGDRDLQKLKMIASDFGHERPAPLHLLWYLSAKLVQRAVVTETLQPLAILLEEAGLITFSEHTLKGKAYVITEVGRQFVLALRNSRDMTALDDLRA